MGIAPPRRRTTTHDRLRDTRRPRQRRLGQGAPRAGRVPGATSAPWAQTVNEDGTFKDPDTLAAHDAAKGVTPDREGIAYCRIGERSSHAWFVVHELIGYPRVRNYDGSCTEWGSLIDVPIEKGAPGSPLPVAGRQAAGQLA